MSFSFGAKTTSTPSFGTGTLSFGAAAPQPQQPAAGGFSFGPVSSSTSTPSLFGTAAPAATGFAAQTATPASGAQSLFGSTAQTGGLFGGTTTSSAAPAFGLPTATVTPQATSFGALGATPATTVSFGLGAPNTNAAAPSLGLSFGAPATSTPTLGGLGTTLGTTTTTSGTQKELFLYTFSKERLSFGAPATSTPTLGGLGTTLGTTTTTSGGLTFGSGTGTGLTFGATSTAQSAGGLSFGLGTTAPTSTAAGLTFGGLGGANLTATSIITSAAAAPSVGLGGIATTQAKSAVTTQKETPPKDQPLPNEILKTVEEFKEFVKQQKVYSSEIARCSVREFRKVEQEIDLLNSYIADVEKQLQKNRQLAEKLKHDTAQNVQYVEMAQRTHDTPPGLQYENTAPLKFFLQLADHFEQTMQMLKIQIESADSYVKDHKNPNDLTPQDLALGMRRLHETFVALAGRLQSVHSQVESQKETYLNMRKLILNDTSNPFEKTITTGSAPLKSLIVSPPKVGTGPTPFSNFAIGNMTLGLQQQNTRPPPPAYPGIASSATPGFGNTSFLTTSTASTTSLFGSTLGQQNTMASSLQPQRPVVGNKRGKID